MNPMPLFRRDCHPVSNESFKTPIVQWVQLSPIELVVDTARKGYLPILSMYASLALLASLSARSLQPVSLSNSKATRTIMSEKVSLVDDSSSIRPRIPFSRPKKTSSLETCVCTEQPPANASSEALPPSDSQYVILVLPQSSKASVITGVST